MPGAKLRWDADRGSHEQSAAVGVGIPVGAELQLGPGALMAELLLEYSKLDHVVIGKTSTGGLCLGLGYRVLL